MLAHLLSQEPHEVAPLRSGHAAPDEKGALGLKRARCDHVARVTFQLGEHRTIDGRAHDETFVVHA